MVNELYKPYAKFSGPFMRGKRYKVAIATFSSLFFYLESEDFKKWHYRTLLYQNTTACFEMP